MVAVLREVFKASLAMEQGVVAFAASPLYLLNHKL